ncbi:MAG TPA: UDP-N-acetylmuramoyl-tripeptide--D-alanyl-D-alanine ligase, partial [Myxococcota bacterium]|nr:UDP-N-acetylmuramoyl-tripeptide--D-alanyl-D-alanine ligase [Myxococcota bacterium]
LGNTAPALHRQVGEAAARSGIAWVLALGPNATETAAGARDNGAQGEAFSDIEALNQKLVSGMRRGDWITVKGSRGMKMERVVDHLTGQAAGDHH